jgi:hypothetical protein
VGAIVLDVKDMSLKLLSPHSSPIMQNTNHSLSTTNRLIKFKVSEILETIEENKRKYTDVSQEHSCSVRFIRLSRFN